MAPYVYCYSLCNQFISRKVSIISWYNNYDATQHAITIWGYPPLVRMHIFFRCKKGPILPAPPPPFLPATFSSECKALGIVSFSPPTPRLPCHLPSAPPGLLPLCTLPPCPSMASHGPQWPTIALHSLPWPAPGLPWPPAAPLLPLCPLPRKAFVCRPPPPCQTTFACLNFFFLEWAFLSERKGVFANPAPLSSDERGYALGRGTYLYECFS